MTNILLITVDSLRKDAVGVYGGEAETPTIDRLAAEGAALDTAVAPAPYTAASFPGMFFGQLLPNSTKDTYRVEGESIASVLKEKGYETAAFHSNPYLSASYGYDDGFDTFEEFGGETTELNERTTRLKRFLKRHDRLGKLLRIPYYYYTHWKGTKPFLDGREINDEFFSWLQGADQPFFSWIHYMDAHHPYMPEDSEVPLFTRARIMRKLQQSQNLTETERDIAIQLYHQKVEAVDQYINEIVTRVQEAYPDTLIVITADHGEAFGEHGYYLHRPVLYDELLQVPLIVNQVEPVEGRQFSLRQLKLFLAHVARGEPDVSRLATERAYCVAKDLEGNVSVAERTPQEKYIVNEGQENEVYELAEDPVEQRNRIEERRDPDREVEIRSQIDRVEGSLVEKDEDVKKRLRDLGYES